MGANFARLKKLNLNWCRCGCAKRRRGRSLEDDGDDNCLEQTPRKSSSEILKELRSAGIVPQATRGGMAFKIEPSHDDTPVGPRPRRLPSLSSRNKVHPLNTSGITYDSQERSIMAEVRRQEHLDERGRMGREHSERRIAVLQRRDEKIRERIRKTENKLAGK